MDKRVDDFGQFRDLGFERIVRPDVVAGGYSDALPERGILHELLYARRPLLFGRGKPR